MKLLPRLFIIFVMILSGLAIYIVWGQGLFTTVKNNFDGQCMPVAGAPGSEDLTIDQETGIAYLSSFDRYAQAAGSAAHGAIFAIDLNLRNPALKDLTSHLGLNFDPHGLSLWHNPDPSGNDRLFVINHFGGDHSIEVFEIVDGTLRHIRTVTSSALVSPNDLVAVGPDQFLATNDSHYTSGWQQLAEKFLRLPVANVVHYDGTRFTEFIGDVTFPNGINISQDGQQLYVALLGPSVIQVFDRNPKNGAFSAPRSISVPGQPDNIEVMADGTLLVGLHTKMLDLFLGMLDPAVDIPSRVVRIDPATADVSIVYDNTGEELTAASVASTYRNRLVIGAIADPKVLICDLP